MGVSCITSGKGGGSGELGGGATDGNIVRMMENSQAPSFSQNSWFFNCWQEIRWFTRM